MNFTDPIGNHADAPPDGDIRALADPARRRLLRGGVASLGALLVAGLPACAGLPPSVGGWPASARALLGFAPIPPGSTDAVQVPPGYRADVLVPWGEPVGMAGGQPAFRPDAGNSAAEQALQLGMHHDGLQFMALPAAAAAQRGLLVINHEYTDDGLLHPGGMRPWTAEKVRKSQAAHGVSVVEVARDAAGRWQAVRPSRWARRITASTPCEVSGPAAGHRLMRTAFDPSGTQVAGTINNCGSGLTPWGTVLVGEENINFYFDGGTAPDADQRRYGLQPTGFFRWGEHDARFDARRHPNEFHRHGWIVELNPLDPTAAPIKRTALGRAMHEGAWVALTRRGRAVVYSGEDSRFEYIYRFVSRDPVAPATATLSAAQANRSLLDHGTLFVARFDADGRGRWLPLVHGQGPLTAANGFADQGEVLIKARQACDLLQATRMDRPEWIAINPHTREVCCALTNNPLRGEPGQPGVDAANPRARNVMGHIIRWTEDGDHDGDTLRWDHLLLAGDPASDRPEARGNVQGDAFACPDGLMMDARGVLWVSTDVHTGALGQGEFARLGHNQLLACDPRTGEVRRFLTGPPGAEIAGTTVTPDGRTLFVNVQHPGEPDTDRSDPAVPGRHSTWPAPGAGDQARPRSATVVVRRLDGGVIGT